jgi:hypothetical protein
MKTIEMVYGKRYVHGGKVYLRGQSYQMTNGIADTLLEHRTERGIPFFREVAGGAAKAPETKATKGKAAEGDSEAVDV